MLIRIKAGTASYYDGRKRHLLKPSDGVVDVPDAVAKRWVNIGSAEPAEPAPEAKPEPEVEPEPEPESQPESQPEVETSDVPDYAAMTVKELRSECDARGLELPARARKDALVAALIDDDQASSGHYPFGALEAE